MIGFGVLQGREGEDCLLMGEKVNLYSEKILCIDQWLVILP